MASRSLKDFKVLVFDVYGTLIDWESGIYAALQPLLSRCQSSTQLEWSKKSVLTAFASVECDLQAKYPTMLYNELLAQVYKALAERISLASTIESGTAESALEADLASTPHTSSTPTGSDTDLDAEAQSFARSLANWPPSPDTISALNGLKKLGYKLVILSNVDDASIKSMTLPRLDPDTYTMPTRSGTGGVPPGSAEKNAKLGGDPLFIEVLTAQQLGAYKPDPRVLTSALSILDSSLGVKKEDILVVAQSLFHDHVPAKSLGLSSVWVDREGSVMGLDVGGAGGKDGAVKLWDWRFKSLEEMVKAVEEERKAEGGISSGGE